MVRAWCSAYNGWGVLLTTLAAVLTATLTVLAVPKPVEAANAASDPVALGAYISGAPDDPTKIDEFAGMVGKTPAIVMWYQDWENSGFSPTRMDAVASRGATPMVAWEPWDWNADGGADQPEYALSTIVAGDHDAYIRQWARDAKAWDKLFYLRFAHEMNGYWYPWSTESTNPNGNSAEQYVAAWRHVHDIFVQEGATNVRWVWNPDFTYPGRPSYASLYPGDGYVDWVAIDAYNWGTSQSWSSWQTFPEMFDASYKEMDALNEKPMMVGETGSAEQGGDKAAWIRQTFLTDIPTKYPQMRAVIWFNENKETDWRVDSSPSALEAYKEVAASPLYARVSHSLSEPVITPEVVARNTEFTIEGYLKPDHSGSTRLYFSYYFPGYGWNYITYADAPNAPYKDYAKYSLKHKLWYPGTWAVVAYHTDHTHGDIYSPPKTFTVR